MWLHASFAVWLSGKPQPAFDLVKDALPVLAKLIHSTDNAVVADACWSLSYLSDDNTPDNMHMQAVIEAVVAQQFVLLMKSSNFDIVTPALRAVSAVTCHSAQCARRWDVCMDLRGWVD
jgi:importin subunit alpha-1